MIETLLEAARDRIRTQLELPDEMCDVQPEGMPPAIVADYYVSLDEGPIRSGDRASFREEYSISVWITMLAGVFPDDRQNLGYTSQMRHLTRLERRVLAAIHGQHDLRLAANELLARDEMTGTGEFQFPLYYTGRQRTQRKVGWIADEDPEHPAPCLVRELQFMGGLRIQQVNDFK